MFLWPKKFDSQPPKPDPIGDICRSLIERWWEWEVRRFEFRGTRKGSPGLEHLSGVRLSWEGDREMWMSHGDAPMTLQDTRATNRLYAAIQANAAARVSNKPFQFNAAALQLAAAVQAGQFNAAHAIIDEIREHHPKPLAE